MATSKHEPIEHFIAWNSFTKEIRYYGDVTALVRNIGRLPLEPRGRGTIRFFHRTGTIDITAPLQTYCQQHAQDIDDLIRKPVAQIRQQQQQLASAIHAMVDQAG